MNKYIYIKYKIYIDKDKYSFIVSFLVCLCTFTYVGLYVCFMRLLVCVCTFTYVDLYVCFMRLLVCVFLCVRAYVKTNI